MVIRMKDSLILKKIFGWALTALLAVEGYFSAFCFVSGCFGIRKLLYAGYAGKTFDFSTVLFLLLPPIILTITIWAGKKFTGISTGKYALIASAAIVVGIAARVLLLYAFRGLGVY